MSSSASLPGSYRCHPAKSRFAGNPALDETVELTLVLRRRQEPAPDAHVQQLSRQNHLENHGADPLDIEAVETFAAAHDLSIVQIHRASRRVVIAGALGKLTAIFAAQVELREVDGKVMRVRQGHLHIPSELDGRVIAVLGFDQRPLCAPQHAVRKRATETPSYTPPQVARAYNFPANLGHGQTIALIELGGGYRDADLTRYWSQLGFKEVSVTAVGVSGGNNAPSGDPGSADGEVVLDIEVAGGIAPGAAIAVYFAANTDSGFLDAINAAIHDEVRKPSVISISWGAAESEWTPQAMDAFHAAFHDAALLGVTVLAAAGDNGSSDGERDKHDHVDFPASSPWVISCGGTRLIAHDGTIQSETVWNDGTAGGATGGGISAYFPAPDFQSKLAMPKAKGSHKANGRGVPDVAAVADPESGYVVLVDGEQSVVGGTSAVAPMWAALTALLNEQLGRNLGFWTSTLYSTLASAGALHDITSGNNGTFHAAKGWDACTGVGTPDGTAILQALKRL